MTCQEANLLAVVDLATATVTELLPLGFKNHYFLGNGLDPSDRDAVIPTGNRGRVSVGSWPVLGMYQPDAIATFTAAGQTYLVTANEGDIREYSGGNEVARVSTLTLEAPLADSVKDTAVLGRLNLTRTGGDVDRDGAHEQFHAFGGRSFSIWSTSGSLVFDSGDELEQLTAAAYPANFNANNTVEHLRPPLQATADVLAGEALECGAAGADAFGHELPGNSSPAPPHRKPARVSSRRRGGVRRCSRPCAPPCR